MIPSQTTESTAQGARALLGANHGYRFEGDEAVLHAQIIARDGFVAATPELTLQLWACETPYGGGPLAGEVIAEAPVMAGADVHELRTFLRPPLADRDYAMVLVLADAARPQVEDYANYQAPQRFFMPRFSGEVGLVTGVGHDLTLVVGGISNPRSSENISGSLSLQVWATALPYAGGPLTGIRLASVSLGQLQGQAAFDAQTFSLSAEAVAQGLPGRAVVLVEWTQTGELIRDFRALGDVQSEAIAAPVAVAAAEPIVAVEPVAVAVAEPVAVAKPAPVTQVAADTKQAAVAEPAPVAEPSSSTRLSLNAATEAEIARAAGITAKLAAQISRKRPIRHFEDLLAVRGVGEKTLQKLRQIFRI
jgi:DNA uptake protein ComE-like DNA-binding protein